VSDERPSTVAVTGGSGFLGSHLADRLQAAGVAVRTLDVVPGGPASAGDHRVVDVADEKALAAALVGVDGVVHAAYAPPRLGAARLRAVNVDGTRNLCQSARAVGARRVVVVSSTIVERAPRPHPVSASPLARLEAYRATRLEAEAIALAAAGPDLDVAVARPRTFLGPGRVGAFALVFDLVRRGAAVPVVGDGGNRYQLLDVRDLADALARLAERGSGVYALGATTLGSVADDLTALLEHAATGSRLRPVPRRLVRAGLLVMEKAGLVPLSEWYQEGARGRDSVVDVTRARNDLGWEPTRSSARALIDAYDWYVDEVRRRSAAPTTHPVPRSHRAVLGVVERLLR